VRKAGSAGLHSTGTQHLAGLVGTGGNQRQALRNAGMTAGLGADLAQSLSRPEQLRQLLGAYGKYLPLPVAGRSPAQALVVERQVGHELLVESTKRPHRRWVRNPESNSTLCVRAAMSG